MHSDVRWPKSGRRKSEPTNPSRCFRFGNCWVFFSEECTYPPEVEQFAPEKLPNPNRKPDRLKQPPCFKGELLNFEGYIFMFVLVVVSEVDVGSSFQRNFRKIKPFIFRIRCFTHQNLMIQLLQSCCFLLNCAQTLGTPLAKQTNLFTGGFPGDLSDAWKKGWSSKEPWKGFFFLS